MNGRSSPLVSSSVPTGTQLNGIYEIDSLIGIGGMGEVFKGHNIQTGDPLAIKIVLPEFAKDELILELFRKEARILFHLAHDAIVRYYVFTVAPEIGRPYLAMEYVDGPSLAEHLKTALPTTVDVITLQRRLADGLQRAHEAGVIHRDISPDNVILPENRPELAKIIDFGIARSARVGGTTLLGGSFAGKYNFVSPEQLGLFGGEVTPQSDIYSLGLVLAAALRGRPLDMSGSQAEVVEKRRVVPDLSGIDARMQPLLRAMLQPDPAHRLGSMAEVRDWRAGSSGVERAPHEKTVIAGERPSPRAPIKPPPPVKAPKRPPPKPARRSVGLVMASLAVVAIAAGAFGGWWYVEQRNWYKPPPERAPAPSEPSVKEKPVAVVPKAELSLEKQSVNSPPKPEPSQQSQTPGEAPNAQPPQQIPNERQGETSKQTETAVLTQPPKPLAPTPPPTDKLRPAAELISFINSYDGGNCFFAAPNIIADGNASIVGYSNQTAPFDRFLEAFKARFRIEPDIVLSIVRDAQCPVVNALGVLTSNPDRPKLHLDRQDGTSLKGTVTDVGPRDVDILLVGDDGVVQNLRKYTNFVTRSGDRITFSVPLHAEPTGDDKGATSELPVLVLAVGSAKPIAALALPDNVLASELIPKLVAEAQTSRDIAASVGYFKLKVPKG